MHASAKRLAHLLRLSLVVTAAAAPLPVTAVAAQEPVLGRIDFPTSGSTAAQPKFVRGVLYLHSFEYESAARSFREAQRLDPGFAMAYWGEALTYTHPVWMQQDSAAARAVLNRLAPTREARRTKAATERERRYLDAVEILYGDGNKEERDTLYSRAMERFVADFPKDDEGRALFALSLLGLQQNGRDTRNYMRAAALMEDVFARNPQHPGAAHYLIHAYDDPTHAPLGMRAARAYGDIAPAAGHALHMTSHIFVASGMWDDVIEMNVRAWETIKRRSGHYSLWLAYGYLQQGRFRDAHAQVEAFKQLVEKEQSPYNVVHFATAVGGYLVDTEDWDGALARYAADSTPWRANAKPTSAVDALDFIAAWSALKRGDPLPARAALPRMTSRVAAARTAAAGRYVNGLGASDVMTTMLAAALLDHDGKRDSAIAVARAAAEKDESYPFEFGPPETLKPPREYLGELLLAARRPAEAKGAFEQALLKTPNRSRALLGLARAYAALGDNATATATFARFQSNWVRADTPQPALDVSQRR